MTITPEREPAEYRLGVALAFYHFDENKGILYILTRGDTPKKLENTRFVWGGRILSVQGSNNTEKTWNILTGGVRWGKETPFEALLRELNEEGWTNSLALIDPQKLFRDPLVFEAEQLRKGLWTHFKVLLGAEKIPLEKLRNFVKNNPSFKIVAITPRQIEIESRTKTSYRPTLLAAAATIFNKELRSKPTNEK